MIYLVEPLSRPGPNDNTETTVDFPSRELHDSFFVILGECCMQKREKTLNGPQVFEHARGLTRVTYNVRRLTRVTDNARRLARVTDNVRKLTICRECESLRPRPHAAIFYV